MTADRDENDCQASSAHPSHHLFGYLERFSRSARCVDGHGRHVFCHGTATALEFRRHDDSESIKAPSPPRPAGKQSWCQLLDQFDLQDRHHLRLLELICEQIDQGIELRNAIQERGAVITDRFGQLKANPLLAAERGAVTTERLLFRVLGLDGESIPEFRGPRDSTYRAKQLQLQLI